MNEARIILDFLEKRYGRDISVYRMNNKEIFKLLVGTVLSQRTRDESSEKAAEQLFAFADTPEKIKKLPVKRLQKLIRISGPYKQKAKKIKRLTKTILEKYGGKVPSTREELTDLYGVGYKTADIVLMYGFNKPSIAIDTHCNRIPKRMGLLDKKANVEKVKEKLESMFPKDKWYLINLGLVSFGKEICKPIKPECIKSSKKCPFSGFCRAYKTKDFKMD